MDAGEILGAILFIAFAVVRVAFFVGVVAAIVVVIRAIMRPATYGGSSPTGVVPVAGRPKHD